MSRHLDEEERKLLLQLVSEALEARPSAIKDLVNKARPRLYVIFAKLSGELEEEAAPRGDAVVDAGERFPGGRPRAVGDS